MASENLELVVLPNQQVPLAASLLYRFVKRFEYGQLTFRIDGQSYHVEGSKPGPHAEIEIQRPFRLLRRAWREAGVGLAESFMDGDWQSKDLTTLLYWGTLNLDAMSRLRKASPLIRLLGRVQHLLRSNTRRGSRRNIAAHYDLGNDFYRHWLDSSMTYSSALFDHPYEQLESAQARKYDRLLQQLNASPGEHLLEIGCGWGGFAEHAARRGFRVTGITLSKEQLAFAQERIEKAGLSDMVTLRLQDYRDLDEVFDHIISIEMFEAVGESYWSTYFNCLDRYLKPGGRAALQIITIDDAHFSHYRSNAEFIQLYIFPGGMLPSPSRLQAHSQEAGLEICSQREFGLDYACTLNAWHARFNQSVHEIRSLGFDQRFINMWRYYLAYCEAGFRHGRIDLLQITLRKPPATRSDD